MEAEATGNEVRNRVFTVLDGRADMLREMVRSHDMTPIAAAQLMEQFGDGVCAMLDAMSMVSSAHLYCDQILQQLCPAYRRRIPPLAESTDPASAPPPARLQPFHCNFIF